MIRVLAALACVAMLAITARADDPERAFQAAGALAGAGDPRALEAYEAIGAARPVSRWTDDAWVEAARLAERRREFDRARADLAKAIEISTDPNLVRRAKRDLERVTQLTGGGAWSAVAAEHQELVSRIRAGGDPTAALHALEALATAHPDYPRAVAVRVVIAQAWEEADEVERALDWLRDAVRIARTSDRDRARIALVRVLVRSRQLGEARTELARITDAGMRANLEQALATAESRHVARIVVGALLALVLAFTAALARRRTGSWRAAGVRLARPPSEVIYIVPIAAVVVTIAYTGNPLVAKAVLGISLGGVAIAWLSGALLDAARAHGPITTRHAILHAVVVGAAVLAASYLAIDHARLLDLVVETWRAGPGH